MKCFICDDELVDIGDKITCINPECSMLGEDVRATFLEDIVEGARDRGIRLTLSEAERYLEEYGECLPCEL